MPRLVSLQDDVQPREIMLHPGVQLIGRSPDATHTIDHPTVSGTHCEVEVTQEGVCIRDLNSTNGSFLAGEPFTEATPAAGQVLQLGGTLWQFVEDADPGSAPAPTVPPTVRVRAGGASETEQVPAPPPPAPTPYRSAAAGRPTTAAPGPSLFAYPLRRNGLVLLVCGTIFFSLLELAKMALEHVGIGLYGFLAYLITVIMSTGYLYSFMQNIILSTSNGEDKMPGFPEISDFSEGFLMPALRFFGVGVILCGPGVLAIFFVHPAVGLALLFLGLFCAPMALLTVALADGLGGLNPVIIFSGIAKMPFAYLKACCIFILAVIIQAGASWILNVTGIPIVPTIFGTFLTLYFAAVSMRALGQMYYTHKAELAWFE